MRRARVVPWIVSTIILLPLPAHAQSASSAPPSHAPAVASDAPGEAHLRIYAEDSTAMTVAITNPIPQLHHCTTPCDLVLPVGDVSMSIGDRLEGSRVHRTHLQPSGREVRVIDAPDIRQLAGGLLAAGSLVIGGVGLYLAGETGAAAGHPEVTVSEPALRGDPGALFTLGVFATGVGIAGFSCGAYLLASARPQIRDAISRGRTRSSLAWVRFGPTPTASGAGVMLAAGFW